VPVLCEQTPYRDDEPVGQGLRLDDRVDDDLDRPRLQDVRRRLAENGEQSAGQGRPVRAEEVRDPQIMGRARRRHYSATRTQRMAMPPSGVYVGTRAQVSRPCSVTVRPDR